MSLISRYQEQLFEAGCDEAGRGCLAGPVFAAAVILPPDFSHPDLNDSKKMSNKKRQQLRSVIEKEALSYAVAQVDVDTIDKINILNASFLAMHKALDELPIPATHLIIDGNRFLPYKNIPHQCIIGGDGKYLSIAAASVLAKTYRDAYMEQLATQFPEYDWAQNKGYGTLKHRKSIEMHGLSSQHRKTFHLKNL